MAADYYWKEMNEAEIKLGFELLILTDKYVPDEVLDIVLQYPQWIPNTPCVTFYAQNEDGKNTEDISGIGLFVPIGSERIKISLEDYNELKERSDKRFKTAIKRDVLAKAIFLNIMMMKTEARVSGFLPEACVYLGLEDGWCKRDFLKMGSILSTIRNLKYEGYDIKKIKYVDLWKEWNEKARNKRKK